MKMMIQDSLEMEVTLFFMDVGDFWIPDMVVTESCFVLIDDLTTSFDFFVFVFP